MINPVDLNTPKRLRWLPLKSSTTQMVNFYGSLLKEIGVDLFPLIYLGVFVHILFWPQLEIMAESTPEFSAQALDSLLQDYAFRALINPKIGVIYDGEVPCNLTGVKIAVMRVKSHTMKKQGIGRFEEFDIPGGVIEKPGASKVVLVYQNLENWSELYYPLPGFTYLAPVLGLLAYKGHDIYEKNLPELDIEKCKEPILIKFKNLKPVPEGLVPKCVHFGLNGAVKFGNVINGNICSSIKHGHFSIVVEFRPPPPPPPPPPPSPSCPPPQSPPPPPTDSIPSATPAPAPAPAPENGSEDGGDRKGRSKMWSTIGYVAGGFLMSMLIGAIVIVCLQNYGVETFLSHSWLHVPFINTTQSVDGVDESVTFLSDGQGVYEVPTGSTRPLLEDDFVM